MKHEIDQYKEELERTRTDYEEESMKNAQLTENNAQLNVELGKTKVKLQFMEEKSEKDGAALQERKLEIESLTRDHESQALSLNETINSLRQVEKDLIAKVQKQVFDSL